MASNPGGHCCTVGTLFEGEPKGKTIKIDGKVDGYLATPTDGNKDAAIVYLPDVIGIWQNSKLMGDSFAEKGYTCVVLDIFNGDAIPLNRPEGFDIASWKAKGSTGDNPHTPDAVDPIVVSAIKHLKDQGFSKIGAVGYCFGAKYVVRHYKSGIDCGYVAHPSWVEEEELAAITGPLSITAAETDGAFPADKRHKSEEILIKTQQSWQINLFSGVQHGFAVRGDLKIKKQKFAKEQAFLQAVAWFDEFLVNA